MEAVLQHLRDNMIAYGVGTVCIVPVLYIFRRYTAPVIFHSIEYVIYVGVMHTVMAGVVRFFGYFKDQTAMERAFGQEVPDSGFTTPFMEFWKREMYSPTWLFYLEISLAAAILFIVLKYRPVNFKSKNRYRGKQGPAGKKKKATAAGSGSMMGRQSGRQSSYGRRR